MLDVNMIIANNIQVDLEKENKKQVDLADALITTLFATTESSYASSFKDFLSCSNMPAFLDLFACNLKP